MGEDTASSPAISKRRARRASGVSLVIVALATMGMLAAACGSGSKDPAAAGGEPAAAATPGSGSSTTGSPSGASQAQDLQLAQCMRSHGVSDFPDPSANETELQTLEHSGVDPHSPTYQTALEACKKYTQDGSLSPAQSAAQNAKGLELSQCMRSHGVPNFPDPSVGPLGEQVINLSGTGIDPSSPAYQAADQACQKIVPGSK